MFKNKYGVARHIYIAVPKAGSANHAVGADWTPAAGDVKISKDGGAAANVTNLPTAIAMGNSAIWDFSLTATEMQAAQVVVTVADSATKAVDDTGFEIETYGNASAQHEFDLDTASVAQTGDNFTRIGVAGAGLTALGDTRLVNLDAAVSTRATPAQVNTEADTALTDAGVTTARMGYVDNLNIGGLVASSAEATAIQNNTRVVRVVPDVIERPDSGTTTYRVELLLYDDTGNMEAPDAAPTIALVNQSGTDRSSRLDSATMALVSTGRYRAIYTAAVADALEQLVWTFSVVEGGLTRLYGNQSLIVDTTAVDFTAADRVKLDTLHDTRIPGVIQPQTGDSFARLGLAGAGLTDLGGMSTAMKAQIEAEVDDAIGAGTGTALTAIPWNPAWDAEVQSEAQDAITASVLATAANLATVAGYLDTEVAAALAIMNKLDGALVLDGAVYQFTANALELAPAGGSGLDAAGVRAALGMAAADLDSQLDALALIGGAAGAGAITWSYTLTNSITSLPIADADVWVTSDSAGLNVLASGRTNQSGVVTFQLDAGQIFVWRQRSGWNFSNPQTAQVA